MKPINGITLELKMSKILHSDTIPLLVSPLLLRERGLGQVDISRISKDRIEIFEVKSSAIVGYTQKRRLVASSDFLSFVLKYPVSLRYAFGQSDERFCYFA